MAKVACVGDSSTHGGSISGSGGNNTVTCGGKLIAVQGAPFSCPIHGSQSVNGPITTKSFIAGKLIITHGASTSCGATVTTPDRKTTVE